MKDNLLTDKATDIATQEGSEDSLRDLGMKPESLVGVLAWSIEELLRRVLDGRVPAHNNKVVDLLEQTLAAFSVIVAQIKLGNLTGGPSVQALIDLARDLRQPAQMAK